ncbi:MAG TPA: DUF1844 domain-containing protein [Planctomycetaceae bacterium]|nr:DUF1844 domain-containing protein [Planctomycetaceae bacterium]
MSESEEPKIIIDEDWKSKVEREKAEAEAASQEQPAEQADASDEGPLPEASLTLLVTTLLTQAMASMGQIPAEEGAEPKVNLPYAKHFIDLVGVIEEKTQGNLTEDESKFVSESLHQMRMLYVNVANSGKA